MAAAKVGVRCGGDGVDSCVQVWGQDPGRFGFCVSGGRRYALGGAGEAGRSLPWSIRRCWANGSAWGPVDGDIQCAWGGGCGS